MGAGRCISCAAAGPLISSDVVVGDAVPERLLCIQARGRVVNRPEPVRCAIIVVLDGFPSKSPKLTELSTREGTMG